MRKGHKYGAGFNYYWKVTEKQLVVHYEKDNL